MKVIMRTMNFPYNFITSNFSRILGCILFFFPLFSFAVEPFQELPSDQETHLFTIHGSNTIGAALAPALVKSFMLEKGATHVEVQPTGIENEHRIVGRMSNSNSEVVVNIAAHGSGTGFKSLAQGKAHIAAASRPAKAKEVDALQGLTDLNSAASEHIVGIDGLAIIIHPDNPLSDLSVIEIAEIFSGGYTDWSQLGGTPGPINRYARDNQSGTWDSFKRMILGKRYDLAADAERFESNDELSDRVSSDVAAIGFVGLPSVRKSKLVAISDGSAKALLPNQLTVSTEDYALARRLYFYTDDEPNNRYVVEFIQYVQQQTGQNIVADTGFVSQNVKAVVPEFYQTLPQDFKEITSEAKRLTVNFRFKEGSARLDNRALQDIERLVTYLNSSAGREVVLIGFGDQKKSEKRSQLLSKLRAMAVRRELVRNGIYPKASVGYGESLPVASNNRSEGRLKNRRVEVWVRES